MREFLNTESPWWVVAYTELAVKTAAFVLFDVYDPCHLWSLSHEMIQGIRCLDLETFLGNAGNAREFLALIVEIEWSRFRDLLSQCSVRGALPSLARGRTGAVRTFVITIRLSGVS